MSIIRWQVTWLSDEAVRVEFESETPYSLIDGKRRYSKASPLVVYYATEAEALEAIKARRAKEDEAMRLQRIKDAGPELLAALEKLLAMGTPFMSAIEENADFEGIVDFEKWWQETASLVAKVKGE